MPCNDFSIYKIQNCISRIIKNVGKIYFNTDENKLIADTQINRVHNTYLNHRKAKQTN